MKAKDIFDISGKLALVTGSTQGLGISLAKGLASAGCKVVLNGRDENKLNTAVEQFNKDGFEVYGSVFDVTNEKQIVNEVEKIESKIGAIDILVNNAGIMIRKPLEEFEHSEWQRIIDTNLTGAFLVSKAVVKKMINRNAGKIINICSIQSELARPTIAPYTAAKGGLKNLTKAMATDWGKYNIQSNGIAPGYFKTEMTKALHENKDFDSWLRSRTPANRWGDPEELTGALIFLSSKASNYVNGHILFVDGGLMSCV